MAEERFLTVKGRVIAPCLLQRYAAGMKCTLLSLVLLLVPIGLVMAEDARLPKACIDGNGPGWRALGESDFVNVNCDPDTWSFNNGQIQCTGKPTGVMRMNE